MKTETAYSSEALRVVTAEEAHNGYLSGLIVKKKGFVCVDDQCEAQITCANMDKKDGERKMPPHFKVYSKHSSDCRHAQSIKFIAPTCSDRSAEMSLANLAKYSDKFRMPSSFDEDLSNKVSDDKHDTGVRTRSNPIAEQSTRERRSIHSSLRSMVAKFDRLSERKRKFSRIEIEDFEIPYSNLFIHIDKQYIRNISEDIRVYHGQAFVNEGEKIGSFRIKFISKLEHNNEMYTTSFLITNDMMRDSIDGAVNNQTLDHMCLKNYPGYFYVLGKLGHPGSCNNHPFIHIGSDHIKLIHLK